MLDGTAVQAEGNQHAGPPRSRSFNQHGVDVLEAYRPLPSDVLEAVVADPADGTLVQGKSVANDREDGRNDERRQDAKFPWASSVIVPSLVLKKRESRTRQDAHSKDGEWELQASRERLAFHYASSTRVAASTSV